jgi:regulator of nucleoside diphosphate kinase
MQPFVTHMDARRLRSLLSTPVARHTRNLAELLGRKLDRARLVPATAVPPNVVTMNSRLSCLDLASAKELELSLVYPWASSPEAGRISILSPLGIDLLGAIPGRSIGVDGLDWTVLSVAYQPEAERSFHL